MPLTHLKKPHDYGELNVELFSSGKYSDAVVECGDQSWKVHKSVVCQRSEWFRKALDGPFKETAAAKVIIEEFEPGQVQWLLRWLYSGVYEVAGSPAFSDNEFAAYVEVFEIAEYFLLDLLKDDVMEVLCLKLGKIICTMLPRAKGEEGELIEVNGKKAEQFYQDFFSGVQAAYHSKHSMTRVRDALVEFCVRTRQVLSLSPIFLGGLLEECRFAAEVFVKVEQGSIYYEFTDKQDCSSCKEKLYTEGRHVVRPIQSREWREVVCSDCTPLKT